MGQRDNGQPGPGNQPQRQVQQSPLPVMKTLSLVKGKEHFCFRYELGQEAKVLDALIELVNRRDVAFDWFDAAVLSHQLGQHLAKELKGFLPKKAA
ncbi:MAG TPA: hypothetical protein VH518_10745 [Tepidisphaeraceae bacterium]|jgi:hypothetical protein